MRYEYFTKETEELILQYQITKDERLFTNSIYPVFKKLAECTIRCNNFTINLYSDSELVSIVLTQLYLKINKFSFGNAYSYFSTIAKNYLIDLYRSYNKHNTISLDELLKDEYNY